MAEQQAPEFFIPGIASENAEAAYVALAKSYGVRADSTGRIYSLTFVHDGEEWTATVGKQLVGIESHNPRSRRKQPRVPVQLQDAATVLAIFRSTPYKVVTNAAHVRSRWANPFFVGENSVLSSTCFRSK